MPVFPRVTIPVEPNYLDPTPVSSNGKLIQTVPSTHQNGSSRLSSVGSSSGPLSPQGTLGSPSPPPVLPLSLPPPPPIPHIHTPSIYANEDALQAVSTPLKIEHNNNESLERRTVQR